MGKEKIKKKRRGGLVLWIVLLIFFVAAGYLIKMNLPKIGTVETIDVQTLKSEIVAIRELGTVQKDYRTTVTQEKDGLFSKEYYATFDGTIKAGVDLEKVDMDVIEPEEGSDDPLVVNIELPEAEILSHEDSNWDVVYEEGYQGSGIGEERNELIKEEKTRIEKEFIKEGKLKEAEDKAEDVIREFISSTYGDKVVVNFTSDSNAGKEGQK